MNVHRDDKENDKDDESSNPNTVLEPRKLLDSDLVVTLAEKENPAEVICQRQGITGIGDLKETLSLRKINLSFNPIGNLKHIDQLKELRHLAAYCCRLTNIDHLSGARRVESLMLQQNGLPSIPSAFLSFNKLKELRLDRNQLEKLDNLSGCSSLKMLDISYNKLTSLEGIAGLQSLTELRASHNLIASLKHVRALPNLKEMNVSNNQLTNLVGLELLPSIQAIAAENNSISTIQIPQTYMSHLNKTLDKDGGGSNNKPQQGSSNSSNSSTTSGKTSRGGNTTSAGSKQTKSTSASSSKQPSTNNKSKASKRSSGDSQDNETEKSSATSAAPVVGLQYLSELHLKGNKIESLVGIESYGTAIESIDFSDNNIKDSQDFVLAKMGCLENLEDLNLSGNLIQESDDSHEPRVINDDMTISDNSTLITAKPSQVSTTAASTAKLLRKQSSGNIKAPLPEKRLETRRLSRENSMVKSKYANMPFDKALALACPSLQTLDGMSVEKKKTKDAKNSDNGGFHTWEDPSLSVAAPSPSESKHSEDDERTLPTELDDDDFKMEDDEEEEEHDYNANNPVLVVESIVSREEILQSETVFRGLLQLTKDTITKAVKDNLPPEVGQEVTDLVLNVRPAPKSGSQPQRKTSETTIGTKVRNMLDADSKEEQRQDLKSSIASDHVDAKDSKDSKDIVPTDKNNKKKPAQLSRNPSAPCHDNEIQEQQTLSSLDVSDTVILKASNRPNTPKTASKMDRKIGATKVSAVSLEGSDKPPPPVAQFDLRAIKRAINESDIGIQSARGADDKHMHGGTTDDYNERRRVNSARMDSETKRGVGSMRPRMTTSSTSTVRLVNTSLSHSTPRLLDPRHSSSSNEKALDSSQSQHDSESIHHLDMANMDIGLRRAGSAPLSTINSEMDDEKSIQWNLMPPSELPGHVMPPPSTSGSEMKDEIGDGQGSEFLLTEVGTSMENIVERSQMDMLRPSSSHGGVALTKFRVPVSEENDAKE